jgi:CBS-domain-containing membrane protein
MFIIFSALLIILACLTVPVLLDHFKIKKNAIHWSRRLAAYAVMTFFSLAFPLFVGQIHFDIISAFVAVAVAVMITDVSVAGTAVVLSLTTVAFPISVLYFLSSAANIINPMGAIIEKMEWQFLFLPLLCGITALFITRMMVKKWNWKKA